MNCPSCQTANPEANRFCMGCVANWTAIETFREIVTTFLREGALPKVEWQP